MRFIFCTLSNIESSILFNALIEEAKKDKYGTFLIDNPSNEKSVTTPKYLIDRTALNAALIYFEPKICWYKQGNFTIVLIKSKFGDLYDEAYIGMSKRNPVVDPHNTLIGIKYAIRRAAKEVYTMLVTIKNEDYTNERAKNARQRAKDAATSQQQGNQSVETQHS